MSFWFWNDYVEQILPAKIPEDNPLEAEQQLQQKQELRAHLEEYAKYVMEYDNLYGTCYYAKKECGVIPNEDQWFYCVFEQAETWAENIEDVEEQQYRLQWLQQLEEETEMVSEIFASYQRQYWLESLWERCGEITAKDPLELHAQWQELFANDISDEIKEEVLFTSYYWHLFSYERKKAFDRTAANEWFNKSDKSELCIFYQDSDEAYHITDAHALTASDFALEDDIYIFHPTEKWTYIHTHEDFCGPFFYQVSK